MIPIKFEAEQQVHHKKRLDWDRQPSALGYGYSFKSGDYPDQFMMRAKHWDRAADGKEGLAEIYPSAVAECLALGVEV
jgi:hypothetical protein